MTKLLHDSDYYEDLYDHITVDWARRNYGHVETMYKKWFEIMPDEKPDSHRSRFHLNAIYMSLVGNELLSRYDKRASHIQDMMTRDSEKDERIAAARLAHEPVCQHCKKTGLRITDKMLMSRKDATNGEDVLFMLTCTHCDKNSAYWEDGSHWEHRHTYCPKCKTIMDDKSTERGEIITITHKCPNCSHSYKDKHDFTAKVEETDPDFEADRALFCFHDTKSLEEHRDAKRRYEGLAQLNNEFNEREENKEVYDAVAKLKKLKIAELITLLTPALEAAGYIEFSLDKPEIGKDVMVGFSCLDSKTDRQEYDSRNALRKLIIKQLEDTNWRLMTDGVTYRLGYMNGRLRAYENEVELKNLLEKSR